MVEKKATTKATAAKKTAAKKAPAAKKATAAKKTTVAKKENLNANKVTKEKLEELINAGKTKPEICKELGISFATLKKRLYKFGLDY